MDKGFILGGFPLLYSPALRGDSIYRHASKKYRRWSMDKQNAQRHLSLRDSLGLSPTGNIMGPPGRRQPARRLANVSALRRKDLCRAYPARLQSQYIVATCRIP